MICLSVLEELLEYCRYKINEDDYTRLAMQVYVP